jgi:hypothetical protein
MNEFLLPAIMVVYFLAITLLFNRPKQNDYVATRESNDAGRASSHGQQHKHE